MEILNIGGATAIIEHNGKRLLFDPWMDEGIFHGAWHHFPPSKVTMELLSRVDYVYISHIHEDHCSAGTIKHINPEAEIIIMDKAPNFVAKFLDMHQFRFKKVHLVKPKSPIEVAPNMIVDMLTGDPNNAMAYAIDSTMILKWDDFVIVNANDCTPYQEGMDYILQHYDKIDLGLLPYGGGSGYPSCYKNLSEQEKKNEKNRILNNRLDFFVACVEKLKPEYVMPFADQYVVVGSRSHLNQFVTHGTCPGVVKDYIANKEFPSKLLLLNSGQSFDFAKAKKHPDAPYQHFTESDRDQYILNHKSEKYDYEHFALSPSVPLERLVQSARARLWTMQTKRKYFPEFNLYLEATDLQRKFKINFKDEQVTECSYGKASEVPYLNIAVPGTLLLLLLVGHISWNIADAALFLDYDRNPNIYDTKIYEYINYLKV